MLQTLLSKLITFHTLTRDHQTNHEALDWIKHELAGLPLHLADFNHNGFPALIITTRDTKTPKVWLQGHLDVIDGAPTVFEPRVEADRLYGRGAHDMKFALACYIQLLQTLGHTLSQYDFGVMITTDEEIGGQNGVKALLEAGYSSKAVVLPDGGNNWHYVSASRGIWQIKVTSQGQAQHGSMPWTGKNAITNLTAFLDQLGQLFPDEPCSTPDHFHASYNVGTISGGNATNQVPAHAEASVDIRYLPETKAKLRADIHALAQRHAGIAVQTLAEGAGYHVETDNPYFQAFAAAVRTVRDLPVQFNVTYGSCDARYFAEHGIAPIVIRPTGDGQHSENEWIDLAELKLFSAVLEQFIRQTTNSKEH